MFKNLLKFNQNIVFRPYVLKHVIQRANSNLQCNPLMSDLRSQKFTSLLSSYGFNPGQISRIFKSPDSVLFLREDQLLCNLINWLSFNAGDKLFTTLSAYPELITLNPEYVNLRAKELMSLFTKKDITKLLVTCPRVFIDDFSVIHDKVQYIVHMMGVEQKSIVKSQALQFDLYFIKCRHVFLTRAGRYIVSKKSVKSKNPPLDKVFSNNINTFLKIVKVSEEEYNAFCQSFEQEELELLEDDSDGEDDF